MCRLGSFGTIFIQFAYTYPFIFSLLWGNPTTAVSLAEHGLSTKKEWRYLEVQTLDQVRWHRCGKQKDQFYPCYVVHVHDHVTASSGVPDIKLTKRNDTLIRFVSLYASANSLLQAVPATQLLAFDGGDSTTTTTTTRDSLGSGETTIPKPHWDAKCRQKYFDLIKRQKEFTDPKKGAIQLRAEMIFLDRFLTFVWEKQKDQQLQQNALRLAPQQSLREEDSGDDESDCDSKAGESIPAISENSSTAPSNIMPNPVTQDSADEEASPEESTTTHTVLAEQEKEAAVSKKAPVKRIGKLRAGDLIEYWCVE